MEAEPDLFRHISTELPLLPPPSPAKHRVGTKKTSAFSLASNIIGVGILSIPYAFKNSGLLLGICLLIFTVIVTNVSCSMLLVAYARTARASYDSLAGVFFGMRAATIVRATIVLLCCGGTTAYMVIVKDLFGLVVKKASGGKGVLSNHVFVSGMVVFGVVFPLSLMRSLSSLRYSSVMALALAVGMVGMMLLEAMPFDHCTTAVVSEQEGDLSFFASSVKIVLALPIFAFALICQMNVLPIYEELKNPSSSRMRRVLQAALAVCALVYGGMGSFGYARFCNDTPGNVLLAFKDPGPVVLVTMSLEVFVCALALPLLISPARTSIQDFLKPVLKPGVAEEGPLWLRGAVAFCICVVCFTVAAVTPNISVAIGFLGSTLVPFICYMCPAMFYIRSMAYIDESKRSLGRRMIAYCVIAYGFILMVVGTVANVLSLL